MQTIIHNLSFCTFNSTMIDPKPRFQFSSFVTLPPTYSLQHKLCKRYNFFEEVDVETSSKDESVSITKVETSNSNEVKVHVEVSGEKTQTVFNNVFEKMVAAAQPIPGFRRVKGVPDLVDFSSNVFPIGVFFSLLHLLINLGTPGKTPNIPRDVLLEILGYSKVYRQVIKKLINSAIEDYVKQEDLKVGKELTVKQSYEDLEETFEPGESFSFDAIIKLQEVS
ncbi:hypothetical protein CARUB_v10025198mg [Capsella rubella]|uniref:Trigger factor ribosome-binding bacterial domain-containing protein n=1 Tax=Capsella rubella TaxID=81985 RepID=R0HY16_9BRAS|nr:hypothetical protein CARUB_v10025198mg [Capsella rubella]